MSLSEYTIGPCYFFVVTDEYEGKGRPCKGKYVFFQALPMNMFLINMKLDNHKINYLYYVHQNLNKLLMRAH